MSVKSKDSCWRIPEIRRPPVSVGVPRVRQGSRVRQSSWGQAGSPGMRLEPVVEKSLKSAGPKGQGGSLVSHTVPCNQRGSDQIRPDPCSKTVPEIRESSGSCRVPGVRQVQGGTVSWGWGQLRPQERQDRGEGCSVKPARSDVQGPGPCSHVAPSATAVALGHGMLSGQWILAER